MEKNKGISLIVLIITIIVIIILASAVIIAVNNNNMIDKAKDARDKYNFAVIKEHVNLDIQSMNLKFALSNDSPNIQDYIVESADYNTKISNIGRIIYDGVDTGLSLNKKFQVEENRHIITGYWENWNANSTSVNMKLKDVSKEYDIVAVAFGITGEGNKKGEINFALDQYLSQHLGGYTDIDFKNDIRLLKSRGQNVILSIGGASGQVIINDNTSKENFVNSVCNLIQDYGFQGIDIDIENGITVSYLADAVREISDRVGPSFILTLTPQTVDFKMNRNGTISGQYYELFNKIKDIVTIINMQFFNSGSQYGQDRVEYFPETVDFITGVAAVMLENGVEERQVGIGLHFQGSAKKGVTPEIAVEGFESLLTGGIANGGTYKPLKAYKDLGGIMIWSINGDNKNSNNYLSKIVELYKQ